MSKAETFICIVNHPVPCGGVWWLARRGRRPLRPLPQHVRVRRPLPRPRVDRQEEEEEVRGQEVAVEENQR